MKNFTSPMVMKNAGCIEVKGVEFSIANSRLLGTIDLTIPTSGVTAIVGQNGSGKSTLLKLIARQLKPSCGRIYFDGCSLDKLSEREFARRVGYLPQNLPAAPGLMGRELVALGRYPWHGPLGRLGLDDKVAIDRAIALSGIEPFADRFVETLSGGERQRVWLAMLLAQEAKILLLDEPISALDVHHQAEVLRLVCNLSRVQEIAVLMVIHDINLALRYCDRIIALKAGSLVANDIPENVITEKCLSDIFDVGMGIVRDKEKHPDFVFVMD